MKVNLVMFRESGERRDFPLNRRVTSIGRKDDCDIRVPLAEVSRHHAQLTVNEGSATAKDLGSANGTFLNNKRIGKEVEVKAGDHLVVGPVVFTVQIDGQPAEIRAVKTKLKPLAAGAPVVAGESDKASKPAAGEADMDPISALEALASSTDQTAIDPFNGEELV